MRGKAAGTGTSDGGLIGTPATVMPSKAKPESKALTEKLS